MSVLVLLFGTAMGCVAVCAARTRGSQAKIAPRNLVICGGGVLPGEAIKRFRELAGPEPKLVCIPTAIGDDVDREKIRNRWQGRGFENIAILHTTDRETAASREFVEPLTTATAVWFGGGYQQRLAKVYVGTRVEEEIYKLLERGGVVGGSSAGAAIQSRVMVAGHKPDIYKGLDLLPGGIVDQHFLARNRVPRLLAAVRAHPSRTGYGIDERTALVLSDSKLDVIGKSYVVRIRSVKGKIQVDVFKAGDTIKDWNAE
jgi:cyanophycinase